MHQHHGACANLPTVLPKGHYHLATKHKATELEQLALGWQLGTYRYNRYTKDTSAYATLKLPKSCDVNTILHTADTIAWVRDLITTPARAHEPFRTGIGSKKTRQNLRRNIRGYHRR